MPISINPFDGSTLFESRYITLTEAEQKIQISKEAFANWRRTTLSHRIEDITKLAAILRRDKEILAKSITLEMGKLITESEAEIEKCALLCDYFVKHADEFYKSVNLITRFKQATIYYQPLGVILGIMPWNFPYWQVIRFAVPALLAGNTVLLKHASNVSLCSLELHRIFNEALVVESAFQSVLLKASEVELILGSGLVQGVSVTGSEEAGRSVGEAAGTSIIKQVYELGGSDAFIVFDNVDLKQVASEAAKARLTNCGQSCISAKRFIVHQNIYDDFIKLMQEQMEQRVPGNPMEITTTLAPLAKNEFATDLKKKIDEAVKQGAGIVKPIHQTEAFVKPNILFDVTPQHKIYDEEVFGPVAIVHKFTTIEQAVKMANDTRYGLSASVWSRDLNLAERTALMIDSGSVYLNIYPQSDAAIPFGGVKRSGYGREMGRDGLLEFVNKKAVISG